MLRKIAMGLIALAVVWFGGRALMWALASNETQIRWKLEAACEGFSNTRMSPILDLLAHDFVDESTGFHREEVRGGIASLFFTAKDPETKRFPYRAIVVPDGLVIDVDPSTKNSARVRATIRLTDSRGGQERVQWEFRLDGKCAKGSDGWQLVSTSNNTDLGGPPMH